MIGLVVEFELSKLISDDTVALLVKLLKLINLFQLITHIVGNYLLLIGFFFFLISPSFIIFLVNQFLEVLVSEALD